MKARSPEPARTRPAVLIVDDLPANLLLLQALLGRLDCDVVQAESGNDALRQLLKREFAVMLLDVHMPQMDGYEVARHARENPATRNVPIVFVTATHETEASVLRGYGTGAVDVLFKPLDATILRSKVRVFLELQESRTELGRAYAELKATQSQLVQAAKMASLGELVAGLAHEINNPLAFVLSHLDTVERSLARVGSELPGGVPAFLATPWRKATERLAEMRGGLERIRELVVRLRTFSRLDEGERKTVDVRECIDSTLTILRHKMGDRITVDVRAAGPATLDCLPALFNQALANLVSNAIDAIDGPGRITIETSAEGPDFLLTVSDTGAGIPDELKDRVLEPFFTTKPVGSGTGLGLSITYAIVNRHGGTIEFQDRPGGGTKVSVRIPAEGPPT
ncbi:MAG TPA: ATP-binding protein [Polyangiaceae bacterium]|nr:ATP-binding protein [Polyangiaceae bacterium]